MWVTAEGHKKKMKTDEGQVMASGNGEKIPPGSWDTTALDICGKETGDSGGVGGPTDYF